MINRPKRVSALLLLSILTLMLSGCTGLFKIFSAPSALMMAKFDHYLSFHIEIEVEAEGQTIVFEDNTYCEHDVYGKGIGWGERWIADTRIHTQTQGGDIWFLDSIKCDPKTDRIKVTKISRIDTDGNLSIYPIYPLGTTKVIAQDFDFSLQAKYSRKTNVASDAYKSIELIDNRPVLYRKKTLKVPQNQFKSGHPFSLNFKRANADSCIDGTLKKIDEEEQNKLTIKQRQAVFKSHYINTTENTLNKEQGYWIPVKGELNVQKFDVPVDSCIKFKFKGEVYSLNIDHGLFYDPEEDAIYYFFRLWDSDFKSFTRRNLKK